MLSILFGTEIKTIYVKDFYVVFFLFFYLCSAFKIPIMSRVNLTQTMPEGPKSEHNTRVKLS